MVPPTGKFANIKMCYYTNMSQEKDYVYILSPVRKVTNEQSTAIEDHVSRLKKTGVVIFNPKLDAPQADATGYNIVMTELNFLHEASKHNGRIDIFWNLGGSPSEGSRVDMGMGYALGLRYNLVDVFNKDQPTGPQLIYKTFLDKNINHDKAKLGQDMFQRDMVAMIKARRAVIDWDTEMIDETQEWQRFYLGMALGLQAKIPDFRIKMGILKGDDVKEKSYPKVIGEIEKRQI